MGLAVDGEERHEDRRHRLVRGGEYDAGAIREALERATSSLGDARTVKSHLTGVVTTIEKSRELVGSIEQRVADFGARAADNQIKLEELSGGTFTISNGGVYGSLLSTPIVNPPQSGILGLHAIQDRPVARDGQVVIRPMMYLALTYDHRLVDGREAVTFLRRIKEVIEDPARLLLEV